MTQVIHQYANAVISNDHHDLQDIHMKSKNIAIYERDIASLGKDLNQITDKKIECRAIGTVEEITSLLNDYFNHNLSNHLSLREDITSLLRLFDQITVASSYRLLLATVSTNMCRKFHTDINDLRMLCTYVGPGTNWIPDEIVDLQSQKSGRGDLEMVIEERHVQQVYTGDAVILKGALYEGANPILHRSPPIEESGEKRLLLRIDTNESSKLFG